METSNLDGRQHRERGLHFAGGRSSQTSAEVKFLSVEPLLGSLHKLKLHGIDWVIVGGESGLGARSLEADWVRELRDRCQRENVAFFFKQWGGVLKSLRSDRRFQALLDRLHMEQRSCLPSDLRVIAHRRRLNTRQQVVSELCHRRSQALEQHCPITCDNDFATGRAS